MTGADIREVLEDMAGQLCPETTCNTGSFLHYTGLRTVFDIYEDNEGYRLTSLQVTLNLSNHWVKSSGQILFQAPCKSGENEYCEVTDDQSFKVALHSFNTLDGNSASAFPGHFTNHISGDISDFEGFKAYIIAHSPIKEQPEGRVNVNYYPGKNVNAAGSLASSLLLSFSILILFIAECN